MNRHMPTIEYKCEQCDHTFSRVALQGEKLEAKTCPACRRKSALPLKTSRGLFNGISSLSTLAKDTN